MDAEIKTIDECLKTLTDQLDADLVTRSLLVNGIIAQDNYEFIFSKAVLTDRRIALISITKFKDNGFAGLCRALEESNQKYLKDLLQEKYNEISKLPVPPKLHPRSSSSLHMNLRQTSINLDKNTNYYNYRAALNEPPSIPTKRNSCSNLSENSVNDSDKMIISNEMHISYSDLSLERKIEFQVNQDQSSFGETVRVLKNYPPNCNENVCFLTKDDIVEIIKRVLPETANWCMIKRGDGKTNYVPNEFLHTQPRQCPKLVITKHEEIENIEPKPLSRSGWLRKDQRDGKVPKKLWFALNTSMHNTSPILDCYESEKKYKQRNSPNESINLDSCFNVNRIISPRFKNLCIGLYTEQKTLLLGCDSEQEYQAWYNDLLQHMYPSGIYHGFEHCWDVSVLPDKGIAETQPNLAGSYRLCLLPRTNVEFEKDNLFLFRIQASLLSTQPRERLSLKSSSNCKSPEKLEFPVIAISTYGHQGNIFEMTVSRNSMTGSGVFYIKTDDPVIAENIHCQLKSAINAAKVPRRKRSQSLGGSARCSVLLSVPNYAGSQLRGRALSEADVFRQSQAKGDKAYSDTSKINKKQMSKEMPNASHSPVFHRVASWLTHRLGKDGKARSQFNSSESLSCEAPNEDH